VENGQKIAFKSANGNGHNGNGSGIWKNIGAEISGFGVAEAVSEGVWLGLVAIEDRLIPKRALKYVSQAFGKFLVEPYLLDPIEWGLKKGCHLDECKIDFSKPRQERAEEMAKMLLLYVPAIGLAWEAKVRTRRFMNIKMKIQNEHVAKPLPDASFLNKLTYWIPGWHWSPQEKMIFVADEGLHLGSMYVLNNQLAPYTDEMIRGTTGMAQKLLGVSPVKAHELATAAWVWMVPNLIGAMGGGLAITAKHLGDWPKGWVGRLFGRKPGNHVEQLAHSNIALGHSPAP